jgi:hypothetical protein
MSGLCLAEFSSRAAVEIIAWLIVALTASYIAVDRFSRTREFHFFRVGSDLFLLGFALIGLLRALFSDSLASAIDAVGDIRWVVLLYGLTYCWELFPGLNRIFNVLIVAANAIAVFAVWQHFTGVDLLSSQALALAPVVDRPYFIANGFFGTPEILGTMLAMVLPLPMAAFVLSERRAGNWKRYLLLAPILLIALAVFWSYRPGLWIAAGAGLFITALMHGRQITRAFLAIAIFFGVVIYSAYGLSPEETFATIMKAEEHRSENQRAQINAQVHEWEDSIWIGVGHHAGEIKGYDPGTGNVYFQVLAQTGIIGAGLFLFVILGFLLNTYRIFHEIPSTHYWHRVLISGGLGSQIAFHVSGLYWSTLSETITTTAFVSVLASVAYLIEHYGRGLVSDDQSL